MSHDLDDAAFDQFAAEFNNPEVVINACPVEELLTKLDNYVYLNPNDVSVMQTSIWFFITSFHNTLLHILPFIKQAKCIGIPQDGAWAKGMWYD